MNNNLFYSLFTLFHHDVNYQNIFFDIDAEKLFQLSRKPYDTEIKQIAELFTLIIKTKIAAYSNEQISLTLTGGMDSRIILACLLREGIKPNCLTFGNPNTHDVVFAKHIADSFGLPFHNASNAKPDKDWYYKWVVETIKRDDGNAHLHRAHRTAAIAEHAEKYNPKVLFTGHMGGEGLRGLTYNNYFASPFFEWVNEGKEKPLDAAKMVLSDYFIKQENINYEELLVELYSLSWMKHDKQTNKYFFLYDLVAKIHHAQDIRLYQSYVPNVVPIYLQQEYLEALFSSSYNFFSRKPSFLSRLKNPGFYCKLIKEIYPPLLDLPFANGFTPREYLKGLWYYVPIKMYRDYTQKRKYPPTFAYGQWYIDFVEEHAQNISPEIWDIYDKKRYMEALQYNQHRTDEGYWHKFSNPIFFDLVEKYKAGKL
jgi:hypothetical protein